MLAEVGFFALILAFITGIYSVGASLWGLQRGAQGFVLSARNAAYYSAIMLVVATLALALALMRQDYQIAYVWSVSSPSMSDFFRLTALWGSQAGSLLFWTMLMGVFTAGALLVNWRTYERLMPYVISVAMAITVFFISLNLFLENPFERYWIVEGEVVTSVLMPADASVPSATRLAESANGLNPMLRHFGMAIHPPMLYLGFVGFLIPFAYALAALASGDLTNHWLKASRRWALVSWIFLTLGLILGGRWAYDVLGWGGYWGWDPVENAALLPWLTGTAFIHSIMIQEKRGMLKVWNMVLVIGTFSAVIFGTFATRSGLVESVHSFARSEIGFPMFTFWFTMTLVAVAMLWHRQRQGRLRDERTFSTIFSRESLFVLNNFIFIALFLAVFWGSFGAPIVSELFLDTNITLGLDYFNQVTPPLFILLYILMGIAPLSAWGVTSLKRLGQSMLIPLSLTAVSLVLFAVGGMQAPAALFGYGIVLFAGWVAVVETYKGVSARMRSKGENPLMALGALYRRNPRRYGGYMVHLGVTVIGIGIIGSTLFQAETQRQLTVGETLSFGGYELTYNQFDGQQVSTDGRIMDIATMTVSRDGQDLATIRPRRDFYPETRNSMTIAGAHSTLENDFYVLLVNWEPVTQTYATFKIYINPLVNLIWWGAFILIAGTMLSVWPHQTAPVGVRENRQMPTQASASHA